MLKFEKTSRYRRHRLSKKMVNNKGYSNISTDTDLYYVRSSSASDFKDITETLHDFEKKGRYFRYIPKNLRSYYFGEYTSNIYEERYSPKFCFANTTANKHLIGVVTLDSHVLYHIIALSRLAIILLVKMQYLYIITDMSIYTKYDTKFQVFPYASRFYSMLIELNKIYPGKYIGHL